MACSPGALPRGHMVRPGAREENALNLLIFRGFREFTLIRFGNTIPGRPDREGACVRWGASGVARRGATILRAARVRVGAPGETGSVR